MIMRRTLINDVVLMITFINLNFIKKPDRRKSIDWFPNEFHTSHTVQCNIDEKNLPEFKHYFTKYKVINETSKHLHARIDLTQAKH